MLAQAQAKGTAFQPTRIKRVKDGDGNVTTLQVPKRVRAWWWSVDGGKLCVAVRYGNRVLELAKGKTAVEVAPAALGDTLTTLRSAVAAGELDTQIEAANAAVRKGFGK